MSWTTPAVPSSKGSEGIPSSGSSGNWPRTTPAGVAAGTETPRRSYQPLGALPKPSLAPPKQSLVSILPEDDGDHVIVRIPRGVLAVAMAAAVAAVAFAWSRVTPDMSFFGHMLPGASVASAERKGAPPEVDSASAAPAEQAAARRTGPVDSSTAGVAPPELAAAPAVSAVSGDDGTAALRRAQTEIAARSERLLAARRNVSVEMYSTAWCRICKDARGYLSDSGIAYEDYDVDKDRDADRRLRTINPQHTVPTFSIDGAVLTGFSPGAFESMLTSAAARRASRTE